MQRQPTMNNDAETQNLVWGTRGREFESHRPDHPYFLIYHQRSEENVKIFSLIGWALLPCSARWVWVPVVVLLGALVRPPVSLAQAGFVDPSFLSGMTG